MALQKYKRQETNQTFDLGAFEWLSKADAFGQDVFKDVIRQIQVSEPSFTAQDVERWVKEKRASEYHHYTNRRNGGESQGYPWKTTGASTLLSFHLRFLRNLSRPLQLLKKASLYGGQGWGSPGNSCADTAYKKVEECTALMNAEVDGQRIVNFHEPPNKGHNKAKQAGTR